MYGHHLLHLLRSDLVWKQLDKARIVKPQLEIVPSSIMTTNDITTPCEIEDDVDDGDHSPQGTGESISILGYYSSLRDQNVRRLLDSVKPHCESTIMSIDVKTLLSSTKAAITVNKEIWDRVSQISVNPGVDISESLMVNLVYFPKIRLSRLCTLDKVIF